MISDVNQGTSQTALDLFHPRIRQWFLGRFHETTPVQEAAWPVIAAGANLLAAAPTGSGKTLAAFLWSIDRLARGGLLTGRTGVLYISPLKALNNDIQNNLIQPLEELQRLFQAAGETFPAVRVLTRSGDTPQEERRRMLRRPPEILITTPESLNLMLSSTAGAAMLTSLSTVILDEIHAVFDTKRGTHLITAVDRLVRLSGDFQRICLSATLNDPDVVARFASGLRQTGSSGMPGYEPRAMSIVTVPAEKRYRLSVQYAGSLPDAGPDTDLWQRVARELRRIIQRNVSTLIVTNNRRLCERLTAAINTDSPAPLAYSHHGSLSRELRVEVEQKLKRGDLKAIVSTSSLELGIDIGDLDQVVLVQAPPSASSAVQRIGRAGHGVGQTSCGLFMAVSHQDLLHSAVLASCVEDRVIEPALPVDGPLDVLAQVLVSMTGTETWDMDELFSFLKTSWPFRNLSRLLFDRVLAMMAGETSASGTRELSARLSIDRLDNTVQARKGALLSLYTSGGTIPDRGYFQLRHSRSGARIGELDEEYVWEAKKGQTLTIGAQNWTIERITHNDVFVRQAGGHKPEAPFWRAEPISRDFFLSTRISDFLKDAGERLDQPGFRKMLQSRCHLDSNAASELIDFLKRQKERTRAPLPHCRHLLLEAVRTGPGGVPGSMLVIHTGWGGRLNRPYALALEAAWADRFGHVPEIFPGNDAVVVQTPGPVDFQEILSMVTPGNVDGLIKKRLETSSFFAARFRECAGRALLVTRDRIGQRMPLWMTRLRSQKLLASVLGSTDFPILLETWRTCLKDEFDLENLNTMLTGIESGRIAWSGVKTPTPSPFAMAMAYSQINQYMYQEDRPPSSGSGLDSRLIEEAVFSADFRPAVSLELIGRFEAKRQRLAPGYAPGSPRDLVDWVKERIAIPSGEWRLLLDIATTDSSPKSPSLPGEAASRLARILPQGAAEPLIVSLELAAPLLSLWDLDGTPPVIETFDGGSVDTETLPGPAGTGTGPIDPAGLFLQWLQYYGPRSRCAILDDLGISDKTLETLVKPLIQARHLISGSLVQDGPDDDLCDSRNFEILLRMSRILAVPEFKPQTPDRLALFLAQHQGLVRPGSSVDDLLERTEPLICLPLPAEAWETEVLPARMSPYQGALLDTLVQEGGLRWLGAGHRKIMFCFEADLDLPGLPDPDPDPENLLETRPSAASRDSTGNPETGCDKIREILANTPGRHTFSDLLRLTGLASSRLAPCLWEAVWKGSVINDTAAALRKGIETGFKGPPEPAAGQPVRSFRRRGRVGRSRFSSWRGSLPFAGTWYDPALPQPPQGLVAADELARDRVRVLTARHGILFRELLQREAPAFQWASLFRTLRLMELSGELLAGHFFTGIQGLQFISPAAFQRLQSDRDSSAVFWMSAADPASVCGLGIEGLPLDLPRRLWSNHLVFQGWTLKLVSQGFGKKLTILTSPDDPGLADLFSPLSHLLLRSFLPRPKLTVETINQAPAKDSPYKKALSTVFDVIADTRTLTLYRKPA